MQFRGIKKSYLTVLKGRKRPTFAPIQRNILTISGRPGGYLQDSVTDIRTIEVPVLLQRGNFSDLQKLKEDLAAWLITENEEELIFDDEPDRVYYAAVNGSLDLDELTRTGKGTIVFICPDPYKYGPEKNQSFTSSGVVSVEGTVETYPIFKATISNDTTFVAVSNGDALNMIGMPAKQDETPYTPETVILKHTANTLTGWTVSAGASLEGADLTGTLKTDGNSFYSDSYGTSTNWHGPAMKTSLGQAVQDFRVDVGFNMKKTGNNQAGAVKVALLDASSRIVAHIIMTKHYGGVDTFSGRVRAGTSDVGHDVLQEGWADYKNGFDGVIRLYRKGTLWTAQVYYRVNGKFLAPVSHRWTDADSIASAPVTQVQARLLQRAAFPVVEQKIGDINVYRLNDPTEGQVSIIASAGDVIEFNHQDDIILKNGEPIIKEKAFIGEYFSLVPGANAILCEPSSSVSSIETRWRDRWR